MFEFLRPRRIYLDYAATTPLDAGVFRAMKKIYQKNYFNPGGLYREGIAAWQLVNESRRSVAKLLGTTSEHVIFTRGGTESCNLAILGGLSTLLTRPPAASTLSTGMERGKLPHVITTNIEHAAVLETLTSLEKEKKIDLTIVPVHADGIVDVDDIKKALQPETVLVSVMYVNNEIGTIQPIKEIVKLVRWYKKHNDLKVYPLVHTDAIQAANYLDLHVERLGVDLMSLSGSKIYGPKSSGVLYVRNRELLAPMLHGGDQEFGLRAGTEDVAQIVGFSTAFKIARNTSEKENIRLQELQDYFLSELKKTIPDLIVNGVDPLLAGEGGSRREPGEVCRICNNLNITVPGISGERLVIELDAKGICAASKSACKEDNGEASHAITAIRPDASATDGAVRFTMGRGTTKADVQKAVDLLVNTVTAIRNFEKSMV